LLRALYTQKARHVQGPARTLQLPTYTPGRVTGIDRVSKTLYIVKVKLEESLSNPKPPQFTMVWVPGYEAIPLSIARYSGNYIEYLVKPVGPTTSKLVEPIMVSKYIGVYGPLGKPLLPVSGDSYLFVAGGSGLAPVLHYLDKLKSRRNTVVYAAWSFEEVGAVPEIVSSLGGEVVTACLSRECDVNGLASDALDYVNPEDYSYTVVSGPMEMIKSIARRIEPKHYAKTVVILESTVKCGLGLCGTCRVFSGKSLFLCIDGPGFYLSDVAEGLEVA